MADTAPAAPAAAPVSDAAPPSDVAASSPQSGPQSEEAALRADILEAEPDWSELERGDEGTDGVRGTEPAAQARGDQPGALHDDYYRWGQFLGYTREEIAATPQATLDRVINRAYQQLTAQQRQQITHEQNAAPQHPHPTQAQQAAAQAIADYIGDYAFKPEDADLVDDVLRGVVEHHNKRFAQIEQVVDRVYRQAQALQQINGRLMHSEAQRQRENYRTQIEHSLDGLDEDLFGRGQDATDQQRQNRWAVMREISRLDQETHAAGRPLPSIAERAKYVYGALFGDQIARRQTAQAARATRDRARRAPARPTRTQPKPPPRGDAPAIAAAAAWLREREPEDSADLATLDAA